MHWTLDFEVGDRIARSRVTNAERAAGIYLVVLGRVEEVDGSKVRIGNRWYARNEITFYPTPEELEERMGATNTGRERRTIERLVEMAGGQ